MESNSQAAPLSPRMTQDAFDKIDQAIRDTFSSTLGIATRVSEVSEKPLDYAGAHIAGIVAVGAESLIGTFSIVFPRQTAFQIFTQFYGQKIGEIDERVLDGVGEITNMTYGCLKHAFNSDGLDLRMFIPVVLVGTKRPYSLASGVIKSYSMSFMTSLGTFWVELKLQGRRDALRKPTSASKAPVKRKKNQKQIQKLKKSKSKAA